MPPLALETVFKPQPGWYRGDFHAHTHHSDGVLSPPELIATARAEGLDFFAITDHNTIKAYPNFGPQDGLLVIPGIEVTWHGGHFNAFGIQADLDWMTHVCAGPLVIDSDPHNWPTSRLMARMLEQGLVTSINHPLLKPWAWEFADTDLRHVRCLEIWNDPSWPPNVHENPRAVQLWTEWLNAGYRITAIGGSDFHRPSPGPGEEKPAERLGRPSTCVWADALSGRAILRGLLERRAYVSMGPTVTFEAASGGQTCHIGADLGPVDKPIELHATVNDCPEPARASLLRNGRVIAESPISGGEARLECTHIPEPGRPEWYRLDVWDDHGLMLAVTNPIFAGPAPSPERFLFGEFVNLSRGQA
jgi:hypothetical protein